MKPPSVFYLCADSNESSGGQKHTYRHVDILTAAGFDAYALHRPEGFRLTWFDNDTRVIGEQRFKSQFVPRRDYVVLPETCGSDILRFPGRKVVFNKNLYHGFGAFGEQAQPRDPYLDADVVAAFTVSDHNAAHLRFAYPRLRVIQVGTSIDATRFRWRPLTSKRPVIAAIDKARPQLDTLHQMLRARADAGLNRLREFEWVTLRNLHETDVAKTLGDALIFVFLSVEEGLPLAVLEALSSGCLVVAFGHGPLLECLPRHAALVHGDLVDAARRIEDIMAAWPNLPAGFGVQSDAGRAIAEGYSLGQEAIRVIDAWRSLIEAPAAAGAGTADSDPRRAALG